MNKQKKELIINSTTATIIGALWICGFFGFVFLVNLLPGTDVLFVTETKWGFNEVLNLFLVAASYTLTSLALLAIFGNFSGFLDTEIEEQSAKDQ